MFRSRLLPVVLALSFGSTSCWFHKSPPPRVFVAPPPVPVVRTPVVLVQPEVPPPPEIDLPQDASIMESIPAAMPPAEPPPPPPPRRPPPTPRLGQIFTAEQLREYNHAVDESLDRVRRVLGSVAGRNLNPELTEIVSRIQTFQKQAEQAREQDLVTAVNLARRADLLAQDLLKRLP
jgi:hypothetical protein